jgi:hypothetical protein
MKLEKEIKIIRVSPELRKTLNSRWSVLTVRRALRGETETYVASSIRKFAIENGGIIDG